MASFTAATRSARLVGARRGTKPDAARRRRFPQRTALFDGQVDDQKGIDACFACGARRKGLAVDEDGIVVPEEHEADVGFGGTNGACGANRRLETAASGNSALARPGNRGAVGRGIAERHPELQDVRACPYACARERHALFDAGVSDAQVSDEHLAAAREGRVQPAHGATPSLERSVDRSLSPRPERQRTIVTGLPCLAAS